MSACPMCGHVLQYTDCVYLLPGMAVFVMFLLGGQWSVASELFDEKLNCYSYNR